MDDRKKTLAALTVLVGIFVFFLIIIGVVISSRTIVSPIPDERVIRVIFVSPTPFSASSSATDSSVLKDNDE